MLKPLEVLSIIATMRSQILCHLTAKITYGLKSQLLECHKFESVDWHKVEVAFKFHDI